eukprot:GHVU01127336.1.p1 GENE.GHVU01127336.1~~GHVU01127336.1.p1  ORF type:complete len:296 (-),score=20.68 GHVU01127336.1:548-1435(-)
MSPRPFIHPRTDPCFPLYCTVSEIDEVRTEVMADSHGCYDNETPSAAVSDAGLMLHASFHLWCSGSLPLPTQTGPLRLTPTTFSRSPASFLQFFVPLTLLFLTVISIIFLSIIFLPIIFLSFSSSSFSSPSPLHLLPVAHFQDESPTRTERLAAADGASAASRARMMAKEAQQVAEKARMAEVTGSIIRGYRGMLHRNYLGWCGDYRGETKKGRPHGLGVWRRRDGTVAYGGQWRDGHMYGLGVTRYPNGKGWYSGQRYNDTYHGLGVSRNEEGDLVHAGWWDRWVPSQTAPAPP